MATQRPSAAGSGHARLCPRGCPLSSGREGNAPPSGFLGRGFLLKYGVGFVRTMSLAGCWRGSRGGQLTPPCLATAPNPAERAAWWGRGPGAREARVPPLGARPRLREGGSRRDSEVTGGHPVSLGARWRGRQNTQDPRALQPLRTHGSHSRAAHGQLPSPDVGNSSVLRPLGRPGSPALTSLNHLLLSAQC